MKSISSQILAYILISLSVVFVARYFYTVHNRTQFETERAEKINARTCERLAYFVADHIVHHNSVLLKKNIEFEELDENISSIQILDQNNQLFGGVVRTKDNVRTINGNRPLVLHQDSIVRPVLYQGKTIGKVVLYPNKEPLQQILGTLTTMLFLESLVLFLIIAIILFLIMKRVVINPLSTLKDWVSSINADNSISEPKLFQSTEVDSIIDSVLQLTDRLVSSLKENLVKNSQISENESLLTSINKNLPGAMIYRLITDGKGSRKFTYLSGSFQKMYGHTVEEGMADPFIVYGSVVEEDMQSFWDAGADAIESLSTFSCILRMKNPDGTIRFSKFVATPTILEDGWICFDGVELDITNLKKAQTELQESQSLLKSITEGLPDLIFAKDINRQYQYVNSAFLKIKNLESEEFLGKNDLEVFSPDEANEFSVGDYEVLESGKILVFEEHMTTPLGSFVFLATKGPIKDAEGKTIGLFGIARDITELKKAQLDLQQNQFLLKSITEGLPDSIFAKDLNGHFLFVNSALAQRANKSPEELLGKTNSVIYSPDEVDKTWKIDLEVMKSGVTQTFEEQVTGSSGNIVNMTTKGPIKDAQGKTVGLFGIARDITELKKAQADLQQSQFLLQSITDGLPDNIFAKDLNGNYLFVNSALAKRANKSSQELLGKNNTEIFLQDDANKTWETDLEIMKTGKAQTFEELLTTASGSITYLTTKGPFKNAQGETIGLFGIAHDITERKRAEETLKVSQEKFEFAFSSNPDGIIIMDTLNGVVKEVNDSIVKILGYSHHDEIVGKTALELNVYKDKATREKVYEVLNECGYVQNVEVIWQHKSGADIDVILNAEYHHIKNERLLYVVVQDVTERKQVELELQKLNLDKDRFISILGHDLRSPVSSILLLLELLHTEMIDMPMEEMKEIIGMAYKSTKNTSKLLDDVLLWATAQSGKMKFEPQIVTFKEDCLNVIELLQTNANAKNIAIELECEDSLEVYVDKNMLDTVLRNLISNALKFTRKKGKITVLAQKNTQEVVISVTDNGVGITPEDIDKIFDKTQLFTSIGTNAEKGTGFGLKLCQEFVEKHGGKIWVESEVGKGTSFYFSLPNAV